jgi:uncharacterized protein YjdB
VKSGKLGRFVLKILLNMVTSLMCGVLLLSFTAGCSSGGATSASGAGASAVYLASLEVSPANPSIALGMTRQLTAIGVYTDNTRKDLTESVNWQSLNTSVVNVGNVAGSKGLATPVAAGSATISANSGLISCSITFTVKSATLNSIQVTPTNPSIALGTNKQFTATGIYSDNTVLDLTSFATWTSSDPSVASVSNDSGSNGLATSDAAAGSTGPTTISATFFEITGSTTLTVNSADLASIEVTPTNPRIALGRNTQFTATGIFTDNTIQDLTDQVAWSSSLPAVATIGSGDGLATSVASGSTTVSAMLSGITGSTTLTVTQAVLQAIDITPAIPSIAMGTYQQFVATGTYSDNTTEDLTAAATWTSSNIAVATVSNAPDTIGLATSVGAGLTTITATVGGISGSTDLTVDPAKLVSIDVTPTNPSIPMGLTQQFSASGNYADGSTQDLTSLVSWSSSTATVATVSNAAGSIGLVTPVAAGSTTITASLNGISGATQLTVTEATLTGITITPSSPQIALGTTLQFTATGTYSDSSTQDLTAFVAWSSSDGSVATISNAGSTSGLATSLGSGATTISAALGLVSVPVTLTVTNATLVSIATAPSNTTIFLGSPQQFMATGTFSDNSTQDLTTQVTWKSSNKTVATVSNVSGSIGLATPLKAGTTTISATFAKAGITGLTGLTVSSATVTSIVIAPASVSINVGKTQQFTATAFYSTGGSQDVTKSVNLTWTSSNKNIATVVNVPKKNKGLATGVSAGTVTINAALKNSGGVSVIPATLTVN